MVEIFKEWRVLNFIDEFGPKTFSELVRSKELSLSRNTVNKYLKFLREKNWINTKYEEDKKLNYLTTDGKIELEKKIGKDDLTHRLKAYYLYEQKIKGYRNNFLERLGELPNSLMIDCVEYFIEFEEYTFSNRLPSKDFQFYLAYFLARYNIQYCRAEGWLRMQTEVLQLTQEKFFDEFKLDKTDIDYFSKEWGKIRFLIPIIDEKKNTWFLSSKSMLYELLMLSITLRTRRGTLQEMIFDNFIFSTSEETIHILEDCKKNMQLKLDFAQNQQLHIFIERIMNIMLEGRTGYKTIWLNLPNDVESLLSLSVDLETELTQFGEDSHRKLEIIRALFEINLKLNNHDETIVWGEKYLELNPKDFNMPIKMISEYVYIKDYNKFLKLANKIRKENRYDILARMNLVNYYLETEENVKEASIVIGELDEILIDNPNLLHFFMRVELYKAKMYILKDQFDHAKIHAERVWYEYLDHNDDIFMILFEIYRNLEDWEILEDFSLKAYTENRFSPSIFCSLYFAHLKRQSFKKAEHLYDYVKHYYPEYTENLKNIRKDLAN